MAFAILILEMLPVVYTQNTNNVGLLIIGGILFQTFRVFSKGAEYGHVHSIQNQIPWMMLQACAFMPF